MCCVLVCGLIYYNIPWAAFALVRGEYCWGASRMGAYGRRVQSMSAPITRFASLLSCDMTSGRKGSDLFAVHNTPNIQATTTRPPAAAYPLLSLTHTFFRPTTTSTTLTTCFRGEDASRRHDDPRWQPLRTVRAASSYYPGAPQVRRTRVYSAANPPPQPHQLQRHQRSAIACRCL